MTEEPKRKRGQRGKGKRPAMEHITIRVPSEVMDFYRSCNRASDTMREALRAYMDAHI